MGSSSYDSSLYTARMHRHATAGTSYFTHDTDIKSGKAATKVHEKLDPSKLNKAGKNIRESFDSAIHPNSHAISVLFDVTGSMSTIPKTFVTKLDKLMQSLVKKGYIENPHILFGSVGDATCDAVPLQIGQFEGGNETDEVLSLIYLESGGGGQNTESYELGMYYMARHTDIDCFNKRGVKGYLFLIGDELPYKQVKKEEVKAVIGDSLQDNIDTKDILEELREKYEVFWIVPNGSSNFNNKSVIEPLKQMFGQRLLFLDNPDNICELIVTTIGVNEGYDIDDIAKDLKDIGASADAIKSASTAVSLLSKTAKTGVTKSKVNLPISKDKNSIETL